MAQGSKRSADHAATFTSDQYVQFSSPLCGLTTIAFTILVLLFNPYAVLVRVGVWVWLTRLLRLAALGRWLLPSALPCVAGAERGAVSPLRADACRGSV
jgi:hypothetical protein